MWLIRAAPGRTRLCAARAGEKDSVQKDTRARTERLRAVERCPRDVGCRTLVVYAAYFFQFSVHAFERHTLSQFSTS